MCYLGLHHGNILKLNDFCLLQLDSLPREDLVVFVKKQMLLLKRTKIKNEGNMGYMSQIYMCIVLFTIFCLLICYLKSRGSGTMYFKDPGL